MTDSVSNREANLPFTGFQNKYGENTFSLINIDIPSFISSIKMRKRALSKLAPACVMSFCDVFRVWCALCYHFRYNFSCIDNFASNLCGKGNWKLFSYFLQSLVLKMSFFEDECFILYAEKCIINF